MNHKRVYVRKTRECIFPGLNNAFSGVASIILPCSQPALGIYSRKPLKIAKKLIGFVVFKYNRKQLKIAEILCSFSYLQLRTIENSKKNLCGIYS